jgi:hypothetical protein
MELVDWDISTRAVVVGEVAALPAFRKVKAVAVVSFETIAVVVVAAVFVAVVASMDVR